MLKIFIKNTIALVLCVNAIYGVEYLPSTSPDIQIIKGEQKVQKLQKANNNITFSEFSRGTKITDQYADRGIIFKGDSPFITSDGANPTTPVLSGSPRFNGAIEGHFVDPKTHEPTTVNHFELDAGYFDNLSSTKLSWYNSEGTLIRQVLDSQFKIQHFTVNDEGISYFRIEIVSEERAGYAIDNVSFKIKDINLDKITHQAGSSIANTFTIYLKSSNKALKGICDYTFFVEDVNQKIKGTGCQVKDDNSSKINFQIKDAPYNLVDATVTMCKDGECKEIEDIKKFSVYGTSFDVKKDGFSFDNGTWTRPEYQIEVWNQKLTSSNDMAYATDIILNTLPDERKSHFIASVGWSKKWNLGFLGTIPVSNATSQGLCYGMAATSIANFNHKRLGNQPWGIGGNVKTEFKKQIENHWNKGTQTIQQDGKYKPFALNNIYSYKGNNIEALKKVMYYFVQQGSYNKNRKETLSETTEPNYWLNFLIKNYNYSVGSYVELYDISNGINELKVNSPVLIYIDITKIFLNGKNVGKGGHAIQAVENIKYNKKDIWYFYDNNFHGKYVFFDNNSSEKILHISDKDYYVINQINAWSRKGNDSKINKKVVLDPEAYYGNPIREVENLANNVKMNNKNFKQKSSGKSTVNLKSVNHIELFLSGGKFLKVIDLENNKKILVNPIINSIKPNQAYIQENNIFSSYLFLPKGKKYKVSFEKAPNFPFLKLFTKVPLLNGEIELTNYEHIEKEEVGTTLAYIQIGQDSNKTIIRKDASDYNSTFSKTYLIQVTPATFIKAVSLNSGVKLTWNLPNNPNLEEVIVIRKEGSSPISITDGSEVYRGTDETYIDSSARNNREYYYGIYTVSKNGDITNGQFIYVNTHQATLLGFVKDSNTNPVGNVEVTLKNGIGSVKKVIDTEITDKNGYFSFGNLPLGTYLLEFAHSNYTFTHNTMTVKLANKNMEVSQEAIGQPILAMSTHMVMKIDENETISWDGLNIDDDEKVNIKLKRANSWEILSSDIEFSKHAIHWKVSKPKDENATLRVELVSDNTVFTEKKVYIFGANELKYDFNKDGVIDIRDIMKVASHWASKNGDNNFNTVFDLNKDDAIDIKDIMMIVKKWGNR